ncbi:MAG TPA: nuclear transport factor 2 family protein [Thermoleophilaceae bacterium]|nr:nuclear transport factor 2 family protein [Thermoleophilaceae bacterium]
MPSAVLELIERSYPIYNDGPGILRGDHDEFYAQLCHPDAELIVPRIYPDMEASYVGVEGLRRQRQHMEEIWDELRWEPERFIESGETILVLLTLSGVAKLSRAPVSAQVVHLWTLERGRVRRLEVFFDRAEAFAAAGLQD